MTVAGPAAAMNPTTSRPSSATPTLLAILSFLIDFLLLFFCFVIASHVCARIVWRGCPLLCVCRDLVHRQQRQGQVAHLDEHPMQRRLIGEGTAQHRVVIGVVGDREPREPGRPALVEVAPDANFVDRHLSPLETYLTLVQRYPQYADQPGKRACIKGCVLGLIFSPRLSVKGEDCS